MTILTDPDRHESAPIKGARLTARPRPSNRSSDWSGFMTHYLLDDLRRIGSRVDRGLASQLELVDDPTDRSLTSDEPH
jgi:hypothetical protein